MTGIKLYSKIDAACTALDGDNVYFFIDDVIVVYSKEQEKVVETPQKISDFFPGLPSDFFPLTSAEKTRDSYGMILLLKKGNTFYRILQNGSVILGDNAHYSGFFGQVAVANNVISFQLNINKTNIKYRNHSASSRLNPITMGKPLVFKDISAGLYFWGSLFFFIKDEVIEYKRIVFEGVKSNGVKFSIKNGSDLNNKLFPLPEPQKTVHRFKGVPLAHKIPLSDQKVSQKDGSKFIRDNRTELEDVSTHVKKISDYLHKQNIKKVPDDFMNVPGFEKAKNWASDNGYGVIWLGFVGEIGFILSGNGISGIAYELGTGKTKTFSSIGAGIGFVEGIDGGSVTGFHKGGFDEFTGVEWGSSYALGLGTGFKVSLEFSGLSIEGFSMGITAGEEIEAQVDVMYRYFDS